VSHAVRHPPITVAILGAGAPVEDVPAELPHESAADTPEFPLREEPTPGAGKSLSRPSYDECS